jgi:hypothetical protein
MRLASAPFTGPFGGGFADASGAAHLMLGLAEARDIPFERWKRLVTPFETRPRFVSTPDAIPFGPLRNRHGSRAGNRPNEGHSADERPDQTPTPTDKVGGSSHEGATETSPEGHAPER